MREKKDFVEAESRFQGKYSGTLLNTVRQAYAPFLTKTALWLALGLIGRLVLLGNVNLIGWWVDSYCRPPLECRAIPGFVQGFGTREFLLALAVATTAGFALTAAFRMGFSRLSVLAVSRIYDETTLRTSRLPMSFFDRNPAGRVITRFSSDYNNVFRIFGGPLAEFIQLVFDLIAMSILLLIASPWYLPFWLLIAVSNYGVYRLNLRLLRRERRELARTRSPGIAHFSETAQGVSTIRAFGRQNTFFERFVQRNDAYLSQRLRTQKFLSFFAIQMGSLTALMFLAAGLGGAWLVSTGRASVGSVGVAFAYIGLSGNILQGFFEWLAQFEEALTGLERLDQYLRLPIEPGASLPPSAEFKTTHPGHGAFGPPPSELPHAAGIVVSDLWFRYRNDLPFVLRGINLTIPPGEKIAVVGRTGSGKTSLIQALFRLYPIEKGSIRIGGLEPSGEVIPATGRARSDEGIPLESYRRLIGLISQEPTMFRGTLRDNLAAEGSRSDAEMLQALRKVYFIDPSGELAAQSPILDSPIEERGRNLSTGERQLVCMARCLLQDAPVIILDEATSSVDPRSEEILTRATRDFFADRTQLIIAHRLSTVRACDRILWLQDGTIHRIGPPSEILPEFERARLLPAEASLT